MKLVKPKKFLGQHFLKDLKVAQDIADTVDTFPELPVLEVGPGMGVLTQFLVKKDRLVKVVEVDYESVAYLREAYPSLEDHIIEDDFLKMNLHRLFDGKPFVLTGNYGDHRDLHSFPTRRSSDLPDRAAKPTAS